MNNGTSHTTQEPNPGAAGLSLTALQRRRLLLRGVGKGGAVLAAAVPLSSFATDRLLKTIPGTDGVAHLCTVSGVGSVLASGKINVPLCSGFNTTYWADPTRAWPPVRMVDVSVKLWGEVFGALPPGGNGTATLREIMANGPLVQQVWIRAVLNASVGHDAGTYPYQAGDVLGFYSDPTKQAAAYAFFRDWV